MPVATACAPPISPDLSGQPDQDPLGANRVHWVVEQITATQQMGTHLDGLNHLHDGDRTYNGHRLADILTPYGTSWLGIDTLPQVVTRGLCLDSPPSAVSSGSRPGT